jgi:hypothetical protein
VEKPFTPYSQGDPQWASQKLGNSDNRTIRQAGCCLTSWAMLLEMYGKKMTPAQLNEALRQKGAFDGANLNQTRIGEIAGLRVKDSRDLNQTWEHNSKKALSSLEVNFSRRPPRPMLLQVDYNSDQDKAGNHFVLVTGVTAAGDPIIYDPGDNRNRGIPLSQVKSHGGYVPLRVLELDGDPP